MYPQLPACQSVQSRNNKSCCSVRNVRIRIQQKLFQIPEWVEVNVFEKHLFEAILPSGLWNVSLVCILQFSLRHTKLRRRKMDISFVVQIPALLSAGGVLHLRLADDITMVATGVPGPIIVQNLESAGLDSDGGCMWPTRLSGSSSCCRRKR